MELLAQNLFIVQSDSYRRKLNRKTLKKMNEKYTDDENINIIPQKEKIYILQCIG